MSIQIYKLKEKADALAERYENLQQQWEEQLQMEEELKEMDLFTKSLEFIIEKAHELGLVFENELIFKENDE